MATVTLASLQNMRKELVNSRYYLNIRSGYMAPVTLHCSYGDSGETVTFYIFDGGDELDLNGSVASVHGTRKDGANFGPFSCTIDGNAVSFQLQSTMTAVEGGGIAELTITKGTATVGTCNFGLMVEDAVFPNGVAYDSDPSVYQDILAYVQSIPASLTADYTSLIGAEANARAAAIAQEKSERVTEQTSSKSDIATIREELNNFITSGTAAGDAELVDIRVQSDAITSPTAGQAVRSEVKAVSNGSRTDFFENVNLLCGEYEADTYYVYNTGAKGSSVSGWKAYVKVRILPNVQYVITMPQNSGGGAKAHICFYNINGEYISGLLQAPHIPFITSQYVYYMTFSYDASTCDYGVVRAPRVGIHTSFKNEEKNLRENVKISPVDNFKDVFKVGKNLFNKFNLIPYALRYTGTEDKLDTGSSFANYRTCPDYIPCKGSTTYVGNVLSFIANEYDANKNLISCINRTSGSDKTFTTSAGAAYLRFSVASSEIAKTFQVEEGTTPTNYAPFGYQFSHPSATSTETIIVSVDGSGDYTTIADAVAAAADGSTIYVKNGTYTESLKLNGIKVHIVGESEDKTILSYSAGDYFNPPMEATSGMIENMTIHAIDTGEYEDLRAYCVHIDNNAERNSFLTFRHVTFINDVNQTIGIGLRPNFELRFENCTFVNTVGGDAFYCHDSEVSFDDMTGQKLFVIDCTFKTTGIALKLQSQEKVGSAVTVTFQKNIVVSSSSTKITMVKYQGRNSGTSGYLNSAFWTLSDMSAMNNVSTMNY